MLSFANINLRPAIAALAGALAVPAGLTARAAAPPRPVAVAASTSSTSKTRSYPTEDCLATTVCTLKDRVRWRTPAWDQKTCRQVAHTVLTNARRYDLQPALLLAVMLNESDLDERAVRETTRNGELYAKDSGLMGIHCVLDKKGKCTNGSVRGMPWKQLMDPMTNIEIGARELAKWRHGGVTRVTVRVRDSRGRLEIKDKYVPCPHKTHAFWAHYNHGPLYIDRGPARHYPHRIAVLYYAIAQTMGLDAPDLKSQQVLTVHDPGQRVRTADHPVEARYRKLCDQIRGAGTVCTGVALN